MLILEDVDETIHVPRPQQVLHFFRAAYSLAKKGKHGLSQYAAWSRNIFPLRLRLSKGVPCKFSQNFSGIAG
jgi:hypothetical protein